MSKNSEATLWLKIKETGAEALEKVRDKLDDVKKYAAIAGAAIVAFLAYSIKQYSEAEEASNQLSQAIRNQGLDVKALKKQYDDLAEALQEKSVYDDDEIIKGIAIAQAQAGRIALTDKLIRATIDYAAATGTDLNSAFEKVGKSIGTSTNALARDGVQLSENATASEKMAEITAILTQRYEGQAEVMTKSAGGAIKQMNNALGNLAETIGKEISPYVVAATKVLVAFVKEFQGFSKSNFFQGILEGAEKTFNFLNGMLSTISMGILRTIEYGKLLKASLTFNEKDKQAALENIEKLNKEIAIIANNAAVKNESITKKFADKRSGIEVEAEEKTQKEVRAIRDVAGEEKAKKLKEEVDKERKAARKAVEEFKDFEWEKVKASEAARKKYIEEWRAGMARAGDYASNAISGGVQKTTEKLLSTVVEQLIPGFGGAAGQMFNLLSQDTDKFLETINNLFSTRFLDNISANIPIMVERFSEAMPQIIQKFNEKIPEIVETIIESLIENSPRMAVAMGETFSKPEFYERLVLAIANGFASGVRDGWKQAAGMLRDSTFIADIMQDKITVGMVRALENVRENIFQAFHWKIFDSIDAALNKLRDKIGSIFSINIPGMPGGGGGGGGIVGTVVSAGKSVLGLSHGGTVQPIYAAGGVSVPWQSRGTDTVPAMLTPGEFVVNAGAANRNRATLEAINNGGSMGGNSITINVYGGLLGDQRSATEFAKSIDKELLKLRQTNQSVAFDKGTF